MILQRLLRPQSGLRASSACRASLLRSTNHARNLHAVPPLVNQQIFEKNGVPDCLSPEGFDMAWTQYQGYLVHKLNLLTAGTKDENEPAGALLTKYARHPSMASLFNYASMAHNNHFFFDSISPSKVAIPPTLEEAINESCSSVESLRAEFIATANAMFGPGFVWLVVSKERGTLHILCTYLAGSPYPAAHYRRQPIDMSTEASGMSGGNMQGAYGVSNRNFGAFGPYSSPQAHLAPGAADVVPILCVNTWQHVWLRDWGVAGKEGFLEAWWRRINWEVVAQKLSQVDRHTVSTSSRQGQRQLF